MITSTSNAQVKQVAVLARKAKYKKETDLSVMGGEKMFSELPKERIHAVYATEKFLVDSTHRETVKDVRKVETISEDVLKTMPSTQAPQDILALVKQYEYWVEDILKSPDPAHIMILEAIRDPGNLGTILRTKEGTGATGIIMSNGTAGIYNPKVIHSTMSSIHRVPFVYVDSLRVTLNLLRKQNIHLYAARLAGKGSYDEEDYHDGIGLLIGDKTSDLGKETAAMADTLTRIPILDQVGSLNAAMASAVLVYETARQRRKKY